MHFCLPRCVICMRRHGAVWQIRTSTVKEADSRQRDGRSCFRLLYSISLSEPDSVCRYVRGDMPVSFLNRRLKYRGLS